MSLMLMALMMQAAPMPAVAPDRCVAVAGRVEYYFTLAKDMIEAAAAKKDPSDADKAMLDGVAQDKARIVTIRKKYPGVTPSDAITAEVKEYDGKTMHAMIEACAP